MAKKRILRLGMLAAVLAFALIVAGCEEDDGWSAPSVPFVTATFQAGNPGGLFQPATPGSVHITWGAAQGASHYEVRFRVGTPGQLGADNLDERRPLENRTTQLSAFHNLPGTGNNLGVLIANNHGVIYYHVRAHGTRQVTRDGVTRNEAWVGPWSAGASVTVGP